MSDEMALDMHENRAGSARLSYGVRKFAGPESIFDGRQPPSPLQERRTHGAQGQHPQESRAAWSASPVLGVEPSKGITEAAAGPHACRHFRRLIRD